MKFFTLDEVRVLQRQGESHLIQSISQLDIEAGKVGSIANPNRQSSIAIISFPDDIVAVQQNIRYAEQQRLASIKKRVGAEIDPLGGFRPGNTLGRDTLVCASSISDINHPTIYHLHSCIEFDAVRKWIRSIDRSHTQFVLPLGLMLSELQCVRIFLEEFAQQNREARVIITGDFATQNPHLLLNELHVKELQEKNPDLHVICLRGEPLHGRIESIFAARLSDVGNQEGAAFVDSQGELKVSSIPSYSQREFDLRFIPLAERYQIPGSTDGIGLEFGTVNHHGKQGIIPVVHAEGGQRCTHHACNFCMQHGLGDYVHLSTKQMLKHVFTYHQAFKRAGFNADTMAAFFYSSVSPFMRSADNFRDHVQQVQAFNKETGINLLWYGIGTLEQVDNIPTELWQEAVKSGLVVIDWGLETADANWRKKLNKGTEHIYAGQVIKKMGELSRFAKTLPESVFLNDLSTIHSKAFIIVPPNLRDDTEKKRFKNDLELLRPYKELYFDITQLFPSPASPLGREILKDGASLSGLAMWTELNINSRGFNVGEELQFGVNSFIDLTMEHQRKFQEMMKIYGREGYSQWRAVERGITSFYGKERR